MESPKNLTQTRISSYFTGCVKKPSDLGLGGKKTKRKVCRSLSLCSANSREMQLSDIRRKSLALLPSQTAELIASVPKRKLPQPIFSDDEDSENDSSGSPAKRKSDSAAEATDQTALGLNKTVLQNSANINKTPNKSPIKILQNVVVNSPSKSSVKTQIKKVNYDPLKVMREFFIKVLNNGHLLKLVLEDDRKFLHDFFNLDRDYQFVCIKLFLWKPIWYHIFTTAEKIGLSLSDKEICEMYRCLKEKQFVDTDYLVEDSFSLLNLLTLKDLRDIGRCFKLSTLTGKKEHLIANLLKFCKTQATLTVMNSEDVLKKHIKKKMGFSIKLSSRLYRCLHIIYTLNTFTNSNFIDPRDYFTDISYFNVVFPTYDTEQFNIFYTPLEFSRFVDALEMRRQLEFALEKKDNALVFKICECAFQRLKDLNEELGDSFDAARLPHLERYTANAQYIYILSHGAKPITNKYFNEVVSWFEYLLSQQYCTHKRGDWYCYLSLIYTHQKTYEKAAKLLIMALQEEKENFHEIQQQELTHRGKILKRKTYNVPKLYLDQLAALCPPLCDRDWPQDIVRSQSVQSNDPGRKRNYFYKSDNGDVIYLTVEQVALKHYQGQGFQNGEHCEGKLIIGAFCLLFWDVIYETYVNGAFFSTVQNAPLDMYTEYFYENRKSLIVKRIKDIQQNWSEEKLKETIAKHWDLHSHEQSLLNLDSSVQSPLYLFDLILCIGRPVLGRIFERLAKNFRIYNSGFPDLIVWNLEQKQAKFVEVKGENDTLSIKQKLWLCYLLDIGASVTVCYVEPKLKKLKKKNES